MRTIRILLILPVILLAELKYENLKNQVLMQNPDLAAARERLLSAEANQKSADMLAPLSLSAMLPVSPIETRLGAQQFRISIDQMTPWPGTRKIQRGIAQASYEAELAAYEKKSAEMIRELGILWEKISTLENELDFLNEINGKLLQKERLLLSRIASGRDLGALLKLEIQQEELHSEKVAVEKRRAILYERLFQLVNARLDIGKSDSLRLEKRIVAAIQPMKANELEEHPDFRRQQWIVAQLELEEALAKRRALPGLGLGADYTVIGEPAMAGDDGGRDAFSLMLMLQVPFQRKKSAERVKAARHRWQSAQFELESLRLDLQQKSRTLFLEYEQKREMMAREEEILSRIAEVQRLLNRAVSASESATLLESLELDILKLQRQRRLLQLKSEANLAAVRYQYFMEKGAQ